MLLYRKMIIKGGINYVRSIIDGIVIYSSILSFHRVIGHDSWRSNCGEVMETIRNDISGSIYLQRTSVSSEKEI